MNSRVSFECQYDFIDTRISTGLDLNFPTPAAADQTPLAGEQFLLSTNSNGQPEEQMHSIAGNAQFGLHLMWSLESQTEMVANESAIKRRRHSGLDADDEWPLEQPDKQTKPSLQPDRRYSLSMQSSRLTIENLQRNDSGLHICQVNLPISSSMAPDTTTASSNDDSDQAKIGDDKNGSLLRGHAESLLLIADDKVEEIGAPLAAPQLGDSAQQQSNSKPLTGAADDSKWLDFWMFHDNGISVYRVKQDEGQEMELLKEINGHSLVSAQVDGNWNQLTLCGGLNPEQVVICEWSDDAIYINVDESTVKNRYHQHQQRNQKPQNHYETNFEPPKPSLDETKRKLSSGLKSSKTRTFVYVGQPNLNRLIVLDANRYEIVAIINTEPQPRKLHLYQPNKLHLSKWIRRRLAPVANGQHLHGTLLDNGSQFKDATQDQLSATIRNINGIDESSHSKASLDDSFGDTTRHSKIGATKPISKQHRRARRNSAAGSAAWTQALQFDIWILCYGQPLVVDPTGNETPDSPPLSLSNSQPLQNFTSRRVQPFTPRLSPPSDWPLLWPFSLSAQDRESRLRNRKSVHIVQTTFFPAKFTSHRHRHGETHRHQQDTSDTTNTQISDATAEPDTNLTDPVADFKRSTVITTHHIGIGRQASRDLNPEHPSDKGMDIDPFRPIDLIHDLSVPSKPQALAHDPRHKLHFAYVSHYNERRLFRVSMDEYRYDREIDLQNCDPIHLIQTAQGLVIVQCRSPISHQLTGQLVLDELTSSHIEFNANVRAQDAYLSPDNRYLISFFTNQTASIASKDNSNTIVYVQLVTTVGLKFQYEIKTSTLDISQCSFVWRDGYYAAIFVSTNRRDHESEILSLRLADGRLELMARVPGIVATHQRHKRQLLVASELRLAALSTNEGTFIIDLEENRVFQSVRHHQSPPTLLWI